MKNIIISILFLIGISLAGNNTDIYYINQGAEIVQQFNKKIDDNSAKYISSLVWHESDKYDLDFHFVLGIMGTESRFNKNAKSYCGAVGLMQLMPKTAAYIAKKYEIEYEDLWNVESNIQIGVAYLYHLKNKYNLYELVAAGYNGGPVGAKKYKEYLNGFREIDSIPAQTRQYVPKVMNYTKNFRYYGVKFL